MLHIIYISFVDVDVHKHISVLCIEPCLKQDHFLGSGVLSGEVMLPRRQMERVNYLRQAFYASLLQNTPPNQVFPGIIKCQLLEVSHFFHRER